jgi:hypothetical protein
LTGFFVALLAALAVVSLKSLAVLGAASPWTSAGWWATVAYCAMTAEELVAGTHLARHLPYWALGVLAAAFAVAGVRREAQADPWWWPARTKR